MLNGKEGVIYNTEEVLSFLREYSKGLPPALKLVTNVVTEDMKEKKAQGKLFMEFRLK